MSNLLGSRFIITWLFYFILSLNSHNVPYNKKDVKMPILRQINIEEKIDAITKARLNIIRNM